jgi:hypothetical protein
MSGLVDGSSGPSQLKYDLFLKLTPARYCHGWADSSHDSFWFFYLDTKARTAKWRLRSTASPQPRLLLPNTRHRSRDLRLTKFLFLPCSLQIDGSEIITHNPVVVQPVHNRRQDPIPRQLHGRIAMCLAYRGGDCEDAVRQYIPLVYPSSRFLKQLLRLV